MERIKGALRRRTFLDGIVLLPFAAALSARARAQSKASKASMQYQDSPKNGMHCAGCKFFIPASDAGAAGGCQIVDGSISPNGYCIAYNAK
jgi:High potential iron-sulfur protein